MAPNPSTCSTLVKVLDIRECVAQVALGLTVNLADARLGDAEELADLPQIHVLAVVDREDLLHSLGQIVDGRNQTGQYFAMCSELEGIGRIAVARSVEEIRAGIVEADHRGAGQLLTAPVQLVHVEPKGLGQFGLLWGAAELKFELARSLAQLIRQLAHVTRERVP